MAVRELELVILGSGTSAGVPVIGCECHVCSSSDPRDRRTRCSACLRFIDPTGQSRVLLIDTSPDLREQALRERLTRCDAILFTHNHVDHTFGLDEVRRFNAVMQTSIDIYANAHTMQHLRRVYTHIFEKDRNVNDSFVATLIPHLIDERCPLELFGLHITPIRLLHGRLPVLGFRFDAASGSHGTKAAGPLPLAYCTDVSSFPPESWKLLTNLNTLVLDMLRFRKHPTHMTVDEALRAAEQIGAQRTFFTHMTHDICHADLDAQLPQGMALAFDGLRISA